MKIIRGINNLKSANKPSVVTIGNFDGVHLAHQQVLQQLLNMSKDLHAIPTVIVFEPTPNEFFQGENAPARLMKGREKITALADFGVEQVLVLRFNAKLQSLPANDFVEQILLEKLNMKGLVIGDDFRFGAGRAGDFNLLQQLSEALDFKLVRANELSLDHERVSSTKIRALLADGKIETAAQFLGRPYFMSGRVAHGAKEGRRLGFPTANIFLHRRAVALEGIFVVKVLGLDQPCYGAAYVGTRPAYHGTRVILEVHLLDFTGDLYGRYLKIEFLHQLRGDQYFDSLGELQQQIEKDVADAKQYILSL